MGRKAKFLLFFELNRGRFFLAACLPNKVSSIRTLLTCGTIESEQKVSRSQSDQMARLFIEIFGYLKKLNFATPAKCLPK